MQTNCMAFTRHIEASPADVYRALVDAQAVAQWKVPDGMTSVVHAFDAREGGLFRVSLTYRDQGAEGKSSAHTDTYHGRFLALEPGRKVVEAMEFETSDPAMRGQMKITTTLSEDGGGTLLHALHENLPPGVAPADNATGWRMALDKLAALVEGRSRKA
ncbi:MAG: SRPBCC family protein [Telluria sp.]